MQTQSIAPIPTMLVPRYTRREIEIVYEIFNTYQDRATREFHIKRKLYDKGFHERTYTSYYQKYLSKKNELKLKNKIIRTTTTTTVNVQDSNKPYCGICMDNKDTGVLPECNHFICFTCYINITHVRNNQSHHSCPYCRTFYKNFDKALVFEKPINSTTLDGIVSHRREMQVQRRNNH